MDITQRVVEALKPCVFYGIDVDVLADKVVDAFGLREEEDGDFTGRSRVPVRHRLVANNLT